jgi:hypothetical protein
VPPVDEVLHRFEQIGRFVLLYFDVRVPRDPEGRRVEDLVPREEQGRKLRIRSSIRTMSFERTFFEIPSDE